MSIIQKLRSLELYLAAHPDCEINSECADRLSDAQVLIEDFTTLESEIKQLREMLSYIQEKLEDGDRPEVWKIEELLNKNNYKTKEY